MSKTFIWLLISLAICMQCYAQIAPTDFKVGETTTSTVSLAWTHDGKNVDKFLIERKPLDGNTYTKVSEPKGTDRAFVDTNLPPNSQFQYRIYAVLNGKNSTPTALITGWTLSTAPVLSTPVVVSATQINVAWTSNLTFGQFELQYANNANFTNPVTPPLTSSRSYSLTGLLPNTNYYIRVRVSKQTTPAALNYSAWSVTQAKTPDPTPAIPTGLVIIGKAENSIGISWNAVKAADSYEIRYSTDKAFARGVESVELDASKTSSKIINLTSGSTYYIQVRAKTTVDKIQYASGWSDIVSATTDVSAPVEPSIPSLQASADGTQVTVTWKDNSSNETGFDLEWGDTPAYGKSASVGVNVTSYTVSGLSPCKAFYVRIRAKNSGGNSAWMDNKTTTNIAVPVAPSDLSIGMVTANSISLSWKDNSTNESEFELQYDENGNFSSPVIQKLSIGTVATTLNGLKSNTAYYFRIRANNCGGSSAWVDNKISTLGPPVPPSNLIISVGATGTEAKLTWKDNSSNETGFDIEWGETIAYGKSASVGENGTSYTVSELTPCKTFYARVRAKNSAGISAWVENKTETTPTLPTAPSELSASTTNNLGELKLKWNDNSNNEESFELEYDLKADFSAPQSTKFGAGITTGSLSGLKENTVYYLRIRAKNCTGASDWNRTSIKTSGKPAAPSKLVITFRGTNQIDMAWLDNSDNETSFEIERSTDKTTFAKIDEISANLTSYSNKGLTPSTQYYYRVRAKNSFGFSDYSNLIEPITLPVAVPKSPSELSLTVVSSSQIDLKWLDNSDNETGFELERGLDGVNFSKIADVAANATSYSDKNLSASTKYFYRVRAKNTAGVSDASPMKEATTSALPVVVPKSPSELSLTVVSSSQIDLKWLDNSDNETGFELERGLDGVNFSKMGEVSANVTSYSDKGLNASTKYFYRVRAKNTAGVSDASPMKEATTSAVPVVVPKSPSELSLTVVSSSQIDLKWLDNSENETGFEIERGLDGVNFSKMGEVSANATSYSDKGLNASTKYFYRVRAKNTAGVSDASPMKEATTSALPVAVPKSPSELSLAVVSSSQIDLKWLDNSDNETGFEIERGLDGVNFSKIADVSANVTSYSDKGLNASTKYFYRVRAKNTGGLSDPSPMKEATTSALPVAVPKSPSDLSLAVVSSSQIDLKWLDNSDNETGFEIERGLDGVNFSKMGEVSANVTSYSDKNLSASTKYFYRVRAKNTGGLSNPSPMKEATTSALPVAVPKSPSDLSLAVVSSSQIDLKWLDNSENETGFEIERGLDGVNFSKIADVAANATSYSDKGLNASTKYFYRVRAKNTAGVSDASPMKEATTSAIIQTTLAAPSNLTVKPTPMALTLTWSDNSPDETGFEVSRSVNNETSWEVVKVDLAANTIEFVDKNVRPTFMYYYRVRAYKGSVFSNYSSVVSSKGPIITAANVGQNQTETLVYPNPATDVVYITHSNGTSATYQLLTVAGKMVSSSTVEQQSPVSLRGLESGTYFLRIHQSDEKVVTIKLFKQ